MNGIYSIKVEPEAIDLKKEKQRKLEKVLIKFDISNEKQREIFSIIKSKGYCPVCMAGTSTTKKRCETILPNGLRCSRLKHRDNVHASCYSKHGGTFYKEIITYPAPIDAAKKPSNEGV